jgi:hypothetical protein
LERGVETFVAYTPSLVEISIVVAAFARRVRLHLAERYLDLRETGLSSASSAWICRPHASAWSLAEWRSNRSKQ